jgi:hypothetical protein
VEIVSNDDNSIFEIKDVDIDSKDALQFSNGKILKLVQIMML